MEDPSSITQSFAQAFNDACKNLSLLSSYRYNILIYNLVKRGLVSREDIAQCAGISPTKVSNIISVMKDYEDNDENTPE